jgi:hypothetical protein
MCTDVDRIGGFITSFHGYQMEKLNINSYVYLNSFSAFWSMPMNFGIALYLVYREAIKHFWINLIYEFPYFYLYRSGWLF